MNPPPTDRAAPAPLPWRATVDDVIARWPVDQPLVALVSGAGGAEWSRWSFLATSRRIVADLAEAERMFTMSPRVAPPRAPHEPPFQCGWIGWISYDAGAIFEQTARAGTTPPKVQDWPLLCLHRCDAVYALDHTTGQWWASGHESSLPRIDFQSAPRECSVSVGEINPTESRREYEVQVERALEYIRAGDIFQVNLARRLRADFSGSMRDLFIFTHQSMAPWFGALIEGPEQGCAVLSASPELFLQIDAGGRIVTRPIKGTAPASAAPAELALSEKDQAELTMIVDLMRNDLGRICEFRSVQVPEARAIESHGSTLGAGVWHGVATVEGRLRSDVTLWDAIRATFPSGSITGAPKIRAMQIIDELETFRRGPYCGAIGWFDDAGPCELNVAIRTAVISGASPRGLWSESEGALDYCVGAGIVADSSPSLEWLETEAKAAGFRKTVERAQLTPVGARS